MVGRDLINAAGVRAQISQIEKYNTAVNTFKLKYGYLPGDIPDPTASAFGFAARGICGGEGDGNGLIEGMASSACNAFAGVLRGVWQNLGETPVFWVDLSTANLIEGRFNTAQTDAVTYTDAFVNGITPSTTPNLDVFWPHAAIGGGNYVYVWSGGIGQSLTPAVSNNINYFGISAVSFMSTSAITSTPGFTVQQAFNIDQKIDDGLPMSGSVTVLYLNGGSLVKWSNNLPPSAPYTTATAASSTTCFDNGNSAGAAQKYSLSQNKGSNINCALSFKFK